MNDTANSNKPKSNAGNRKPTGNRRYKGNSSNSKPNNNSKRYSQNKNRRPKALTPARILQKYENLMDQYLVARKKFVDLFGRANKKQCDKANNNYKHSLKTLRNFEFGLKEDWQKEVLNSKIQMYPEDRQYTTEHNLEPVGDIINFVGEFEDPHLLTTQKAQDWAADIEESEGSITDYYTYKGISPPTKTK